MIRYLLLALVVIIGVVIVRLPASLLTERIPRDTVVLTQPGGTLWQGSAQAALGTQRLGRLSWSLHPLALLRLEAVADFALSGSELGVAGVAGIGVDQQLSLTLDGEIGNRLLNAILAPYAIRIDGDLAASKVAVAGQLRDLSGTARTLEDVIAFTGLSGQLRWDGGLASYTLQAGTSTATFPALQGRLGLSPEQLPELAVYSQGIDFALLRAGVLTEGFVKVGVSRRFTELAGLPWPGQEPDDAIVLEVEQQVF
ncbi:MAG: type II secretion system protein N [Pseudomonadota bacterium]